MSPAGASRSGASGRGAAALRLHEVTRSYGDVVAMNRVSLELDGGITALVGPNAAGKRTVKKVCTGHVRPTTGRVTAFGTPVWDNPRVLGRMGFVPEQDAFYEDLTGPDFVASLARVGGRGRREARRRAEEELTALGLADGFDRPIKTYSKGMRQRVKLAQALLHRPDLLLLDEPLLGCDPLARRRIQDRVRALAREGCTVLVSSHILPEVERLTRDVAVLSGGRLVARGDVRHVRDALGNVPSRVRVTTPEARRLAATLVSWDAVGGVDVQQDAVEVHTLRLHDFLGRFHAELRPAWKVRGFRTMDADLDSVFDYLSGEVA